MRGTASPAERAGPPGSAAAGGALRGARRAGAFDDDDDDDASVLVLVGAFDGAAGGPLAAGSDASPGDAWSTSAPGAAARAFAAVRRGRTTGAGDRPSSGVSGSVGRWRPGMRVSGQVEGSGGTAAASGGKTLDGP